MKKPQFDLSSLMNLELTKQASVEQTSELQNVADYLHNAIDLLNDLNLETQASKVEKVLYKIAGLTKEDDLLDQEINVSDENFAEDDELSFEDEV